MFGEKVSSNAYLLPLHQSKFCKLQLREALVEIFLLRYSILSCILQVSLRSKTRSQGLKVKGSFRTEIYFLKSSIQLHIISYILSDYSKCYDKKIYKQTRRLLLIGQKVIKIKFGLCIISQSRGIGILMRLSVSRD